ncbi:hypothetical protein D3C76_1307480 [compost metagenome]
MPSNRLSLMIEILCFAARLGYALKKRSFRSAYFSAFHAESATTINKQVLGILFVTFEYKTDAVLSLSATWESQPKLNPFRMYFTSIR